MVRMAAAGEHADVLFMDPPRSGSTEAFLKAAARLHVKRIIYVSCNPDTLRRDLAVLTRLGYRAVTAVPVDMFCFCNDVECVCLLDRN